LKVNLKAIFIPLFNSKNVTLVIIIATPFLLVDSIISNVTDYLIPQTTSTFGISFFVIISTVIAISQHLLLRFVWLKTKELRSKSFLFNNLLKVVVASQYALFAILIIVIYQILFTSQYSTALLIWSTLISYSLTISLLAIIARQFFQWYSYDKRGSFIIFIYALAFVILSMTYCLALFLDLNTFSGKQQIVTSTSEVSFADYDNANWSLVIIHHLYQYSDLVSFVLIWAATALLLLNYRKRLGEVKFWIIISLPLIYYLSTVLDVLGLYIPSSDTEYFYYYLYQSLNTTVGGLLFGVAFMVIAKRIDNQSIRGYMSMTSYGFIILYISGQVVLASCSYPPFGITTIIYQGLSSYLLLIGLSSTAISLSKHAELRRSIRNSLEDQPSRLMGRMGLSEVQKDIDNRVTPLFQRYSEQMKKQTAIDLTISKGEVKQYIKEILHELHKK
jgi:hypothetical protein